MLSLILCSTNHTTPSELKQNIAQTIGCDYEIVHIDNHTNKYNIFQAYNIGVKRAKGDILCFMHEDVVFLTQDWGQNIIEHFKRNNIGALGVAGSHYIGTELDWRFCRFLYVSLLQGYYTCEPTPQYGIIYSPDKCEDNKKLTQVAILDGVFICIKKETFNQIHWDSIHFHGFHLYDSDICMQINQIGLNIYLCRNVILEHKSFGSFSKEFVASFKVFLNKWKNSLPIQKGMHLSKEDIDAAIKEGWFRYKDRLYKDSLRKSILSKKGQEFYTDDEKDFMRSDILSFYKAQIKTKNISFHQSMDLLKHNLKTPLLKNNDKIRISAKFIWYRVLCKSKLK